MLLELAFLWAIEHLISIKKICSIRNRGSHKLLAIRAILVVYAYVLDIRSKWLRTYSSSFTKRCARGAGFNGNLGNGLDPPLITDWNGALVAAWHILTMVQVLFYRSSGTGPMSSGTGPCYSLGTVLSYHARLHLASHSPEIFIVITIV